MKQAITNILWRIIEKYFYDEWVYMQERRAIEDAGVDTLEELQELVMQQQDERDRAIYESGLADSYDRTI